MKKISRILAAIPFALTVAVMPMTEAAVNTPRLPAVLMDPAPSVVPEASLQTTNAPDTDEAYAKGVTGCFTGTIGNKIIVAGGCNMTENKISFSSDRQVFSDIYAGQPAPNGKIEWEKAGTMPVAVSNGASFTLDDGVIFAGGIDANFTASQKVYKLSFNENGTLETTYLPDLPNGLSHMGSCLIDNKLYLIGGTTNNGANPAVISLDLNQQELGWQTVSYYPGSARIQPICAESNGQLFIWGGYSTDNPPILSNDGYKYNPDTKDWSAVATPKLVDGFRSSRIYTGGASAVSVDNHRIVVTGGVNPEIFSNTSQKMSGDYLQHNADWYRYNRFIMIYNSDANSWEIPVQTAQTARTNASMVYFGNKIYTIGGEIAPGVCTNEISLINVK